DTTPILTVSPIIPPSPDYTPASPDYSPASDTEFDPSEDPSSDHIPPLPATLPFLSSTDDSSDSDNLIHHHHLPMPIPHGRPYRYHLNGSVHMMTARKRVGPLHTHCLASSLESSSDSSMDALFDSASSRSSSDHSLPTPSSGMRHSHHFHRSSAAIYERPSHDSSSASLSRKRSRSLSASVPSPEIATDLEGCSEDSFEPYVPREAGLGVDFKDESSESFRHRGIDLEMNFEVVRSDGIDIDLEIQAEINECNPYADALRDRGIDARVIVEAIDREEIEIGVRGPVEVRVDRVTHLVVAEDIPEPAQEGAVEV
ncbi:hypothetical protein Tco_0037504, partial [Tanacetum coccineum]